MLERHNEANGEGNHDGHPANFTSNWGVEGPTDDPAITEVRDRVKRAMLATVFFSAGTPMLLAGDEFGRTQGGNNNAYCQDNEISWLNWNMAASPPGLALTAYVARLIALRREHPGIAVFAFSAWHRVPGARHRRYRLVRPAGGTIPSEAWNEIDQRTLILRRAMQVPEGRVTILTLLLNPTAELCRFRLPAPRLALPGIARQCERRMRRPVTVADQAVVDAHSAMLLYSELSAMNFGANLLDDGRTQFRFWAPGQESVSVAVEDGPIVPMARSPDGWFEAVAACSAGTRYRYRLSDGTLVPDPASRAQANDVHDPSLVIDPRAYGWRNTAWRGSPWCEAVLYEVHVGLLGGFQGVARELPRLAALGITAIELMPVADFPGTAQLGLRRRSAVRARRRLWVTR